MITSSHLQPTIKYMIYPWYQTFRYCMPETTISQRSPLADYFDNQNKSLQQHWIVVRWQHLLVAPTRIFWRLGLLTQADSSSRDSRLSLLSAYCLTILMLCGWWCIQRLHSTTGDSEFCSPCIASAKVLTFFFCFFIGHFSTEKRKETKMWMSFLAEK